MVYNALISSFDQNDLKKHQIISKTLVGKDVKYVSEDRASSKDKKGMKFVEIIHTLRKECIEKEFRENFQVRREPLANIVRHMKEQKENKSKLCFVINGICNFLSRIQNVFSGYGFKTSVEMAGDLLTGLELPKVTDLKTLIEQLKKYTTLDHTQLDQIKEPKDLKSPIFCGKPLLNQLLENPNSVDPSWIEFIRSKNEEVMNLKSSGPANELQPLHILFRAIKGFGQPHENKLIQKMVDCGADINAKDYDGCTPLHAALSKQLPFDIVKLFINKESANAIKDGKKPIQFLEARKDDFYRGEKREDLEKILEALKKAASEGQTTPTQPSPVTQTQEQTSSAVIQTQEQLGIRQTISSTEVQPVDFSKLPSSVVRDDAVTFPSPIIEDANNTKKSKPVSKEELQIIFKKLMALLPNDLHRNWKVEHLNDQVAREELARKLILYSNAETLEKVEQGIKELITLGIDINAEDSTYKETILVSAIAKFYVGENSFNEGQKVKLFKFLLDNGASPSEEFLNLIINQCKKDTEVLKLFLKNIDESMRLKLNAMAYIQTI